jgi:hypothetical protein
MIRTYGWNEGRIGMVMAPMLLASLLGHFPGRRVRGMDGQAPQGCQRALRGDPVRPGHDLRDHGAADAHGRDGLAVMALGGMFGLAGAVPQNAAIQRIAPNEMRGQVTAIYLFMFTFFGAMGSFVVGVVAQRVVGVEAELWKALVITAGALLPIATISMILAIRPYREEVARLEAQGR